MKFKDVRIWPKERCAIGREEMSGRLYLSIPVGNRLADYEEYYELGEAEFALFIEDREAAAAFAERCRRREMDHLLIIRPGTDRGS